MSAGHVHTADPLGIAPIGSVRPVNWVYDRAPMTVYWEMTIACALACRHCRATAWKRPAPDQLTTEQGVRLLDQIAGFGDPLPHLILTGGDPLRRDDLIELMHQARARRIGVSLSPAVTPDLTRGHLAQLQEAGAKAVSLSLDGSNPELHDGVRRVAGIFDLTMQALDWAGELDIPVQINTLVTAATAPDLPALYELLKTKPMQRWTLFFLIHTGRGKMLEELTPLEAEQVLTWLNELRGVAPFQLSTTEALHFRRVTAQSMEARGMTREQIAVSPAARAFGVRDGNGIVFISHNGTVTPSGFLPMPLGNVKQDDLVELYRHHPLMDSLRTPSSFGGDCGVCEYNSWCGGARSRAYAATGDPLAADPLCTYRPAAVRNQVA
ncbi:TIGR04053 family radical SAM/SPASM domain-containing protein [Brooklawnia sp.]|uniref:TIGR04053 family radical SAM/SPASM domain-containing protein n=1 Tax=Brooklawnia sp. TaxID=2699740 RepID=UPI00311ED162